MVGLLFCDILFCHISLVCLLVFTKKVLKVSLHNFREKLIDFLWCQLLHHLSQVFGGAGPSQVVSSLKLISPKP